MNYLDYETFKKVHPLAQGLENEDNIKICYLRQYIENIKMELSNNDFQAIKYSEGWYTEEEYEPIKSEREAMREKIRELEKELEKLENI